MAFGVTYYSEQYSQFLPFGQHGIQERFDTYRPPSTYDGPYAESSGVIWVDGVLIAADADYSYQYQSTLPSQFQDNYVYASVDYEIHQGPLSKYSDITNLQVVNHTDSTLVLDRVVIQNSEYSPNATFLVKPGQLINFSVDNRRYGGTVGVNFVFSSQFYNPIFLFVQYP
jgi:hypothetical protein